jgi:hypothetical protein
MAASRSFCMRSPFMMGMLEWICCMCILNLSFFWARVRACVRTMSSALGGGLGR